MKEIRWSEDKNQRLKAERNVSFEEILVYIEEGKVVASYKHPNKKKYPNQRIMAIDFNNCAFLVPYTEVEKEIFLITIIPSRKATKNYLTGEK